MTELKCEECGASYEHLYPTFLGAMMRDGKLLNFYAVCTPTDVNTWYDDADQNGIEYSEMVDYECDECGEQGYDENVMKSLSNDLVKDGWVLDGEYYRFKLDKQEE